jgi:hypothetical protein
MKTRTMKTMTRRRFSQVYTEQTVSRLQARNVKFARGGSHGLPLLASAASRLSTQKTLQRSF